MSITIKSIYGTVIKELDAETLRDACLRGADLSGADLSGADLSGANLRYTNLSDANLRYTKLSGADLSGADLRGTDLESQWIIQGPCRLDGHWFFIQKLTDDKEPMIKAGCRYFTMQEAKDHWQSTRGGTQLGDETMLILKFLNDAAKVRGLM